MLTGVPGRVLEVLGLQPDRITSLKDVPLQNGSWLLEMADGMRLVLRRYHDRATLPDLSYELSVEPVNHAFRVDMTAWQMDHGRRTGGYDLTMIERQPSRTGTAPP